MYLKQLHMVGFKSFAQPVRVELGPGITAVVGPNGSGKSNIVDAVRWVLGEQSARALRGAKSEDVIFAGSAARRPVGMAEVTLVLDNSDGRVAVDSAEIAIARRLYRSGDTEYLVNRRRARLRDVLDVAGQAGLGPDSYCVVGQGAIEQLVLQRPQERRALIADAADVRRYEARLAEIESDLNQTQANALRASAVAAEILPQLDRLRVQAQRAERHRRARDEVERLAAAWYARALPSARGAVSEARRRRADLQATIAGLRADLGAIERRQTELHEKRTALTNQLRGLQERLRQARDEREGLRVEHAALAERTRSLADRVVAAERQLNALSERVATVEASLSRSDEALGEAAADAEKWGSPADVGTQQAAEAGLGEARRAQADAQRELDAARGALDRLDHEQVQARSAVEAAATANAVNEARRAESEARVAELIAGTAEAERALNASKGRSEGLEPRVVAAREKLDEAAERHVATAAALDAAKRSLDRLLGEDRALSALFPAEQAESWKWRLLARLPAPTRYARAITAALGEAAGFRLVEGETAWFQDVSDEDPHSSVLAPTNPAPSTDLEGFRDWVSAVLGADHSFVFAVDVLDAGADPLLAQRYLANAIVVESVEDARRAASALRTASPNERKPFPFRIATQTGECFWASGERARRPAGELPLEVFARRSEVAHELAAAQAQVGSAESDRALAQKAEDEARGKLAVAEQERQRALAETRQRETQLRAAGAEIRRELERSARLLESKKEDMQLPLFSNFPERREAALRGVEEAARLLRLRGEEVYRAEEDRRAALERHAQTAAQRALATERLARRQEAADRDAREVARARQEVVNQTQERDRTQAEVARLAVDLEAVRGRLATAERSAADLESEVAQLGAAVSENEVARVAVDAQEREAQTRLADLREAEATVGAEMERATAMVERYEAEVAAVAEAMGVEAAFFARTLDQKNVAAAELASENDDDLRERLARAQRDLRSVGAVDYGVMADYSVLKDRYESLSRQIEDLAQAEASIRAGMADVRDQMRSQFMAAFEDVNRRFADLFRHLFRGGDAELLLAGDPDSTQAGVDIVAQPPGKRLHRLATLSGGERALVGAALLLALIGANPSPFCMLDEVDAALDEANVQRFVETIRELARGTQFILVTHNRATMEAADALYGVTMGAGAVSQVVAIRLDDAIPAT